jgi:hypothetical protein
MSRINGQNPNLPERVRSRPPLNGKTPGPQSPGWARGGPVGGFGGIGGGDVPIIPTGHNFTGRPFRPCGVRYGIANGHATDMPPCPPPTYHTWRWMQHDPTIAIACAVSWGPIIGSAWSYKGANKGVSQEWIDFAREVYSPFESLLKTQMLKELNMGCRSFFQQYEARPFNGKLRVAVKRFKPLRWELTYPLVDPQTGDYAGLRNAGIDFDPEQTLHYAYDVEDDDWLGNSRLENIREDAWWPWRCHQRTAYKLGAKQSAIIPIVKGPLSGEDDDGNGNKITGVQAAQSMVDNLTEGLGVFMENMSASDGFMDDPKLAAASKWVVEFYDSKSSSTAIGPTIDTMRYYDSLKLRGYLQPERTATEGQHGTKAEVAEQADVGLADGEQVHLNMVQVVNWHSLDRLLVWNFGEESRGQVLIEPAPLIDEKRAIFKWIWNALMANAGIVDLLASKIDLDATADALGIPITGPINPDSGKLDTAADPFAGQPSKKPTAAPPAMIAASRATRTRLAALAILSAAGKRAANRERLQGKRMKRRGRHA